MRQVHDPGSQTGNRRRIRYREIASDLAERVGQGEFSAGQLLPSESELSAAYSASRVTVRRALEVLRDDGLVDSRQGFGWFVAADPVRQTLGRLGTIESQLEATGNTSERRILDFRFVPSPPTVAQVLGAETVLEVRRLNLADGRPFARITVWCPEDLGANLSRADVEQSPFYELVPVELGGARQTIGAAAAEADDAELLGVPAGSPVLGCRRVTSDRDGKPVLMSEHIYPAHLTEFVVDIPRVESSLGASGLRLVE
ncbi:MAG: GntR family transcriptional regulator [Actinomycetia bacterium]|nr:GntR family transcriptional regulator [Actinomycetes bacterium]